MDLLDIYSQEELARLAGAYGLVNYLASSMHMTKMQEHAMEQQRLRMEERPKGPYLDIETTYRVLTAPSQSS